MKDLSWPGGTYTVPPVEDDTPPTDLDISFLINQLGRPSNGEVQYRYTNVVQTNDSQKEEGHYIQSSLNLYDNYMAYVERISNPPPNMPPNMLTPSPETFDDEQVPNTTQLVDVNSLNSLSNVYDVDIYFNSVKSLYPNMEAFEDVCVEEKPPTAIGFPTDIPVENTVSVVDTHAECRISQDCVNVHNALNTGNSLEKIQDFDIQNDHIIIRDELQASLFPTVNSNIPVENMPDQDLIRDIEDNSGNIPNTYNLLDAIQDLGVPTDSIIPDYLLPISDHHAASVEDTSIINMELSETNVDRIVGKQLNSSVEIGSHVKDKKELDKYCKKFEDDNVIGQCDEVEVQDVEVKNPDHEVKLQDIVIDKNINQEIKPNSSSPKRFPKVQNIRKSKKPKKNHNKRRLLGAKWLPGEMPGTENTSAEIYNKINNRTLRSKSSPTSEMDDNQRILRSKSKLNAEPQTEHLVDSNAFPRIDSKRRSPSKTIPSEVNIAKPTKIADKIRIGAPVKKLNMEMKDYHIQEEEIDVETVTETPIIQGHDMMCLFEKPKYTKVCEEQTSPKGKDGIRENKHIKKQIGRKQGLSRIEESLIKKTEAKSQIKKNKALDSTIKKLQNAILKSCPSYKINMPKARKCDETNNHSQKKDNIKQEKNETMQHQKDKDHKKIASKPEPKIVPKSSIKGKEVPKELIGRIKESNKPTSSIVLLDDPMFLGGDPLVMRKKSKKSPSRSPKSNLIVPSKAPVNKSVGNLANIKANDRKDEKDKPVMKLGVSQPSSKNQNLNQSIKSTNTDRTLENWKPVQPAVNGSVVQANKNVNITVNTPSSSTQAIVTSPARRVENSVQQKPAMSSPSTSPGSTPKTAIPLGTFMKNFNGNKKPILIPIKNLPSVPTMSTLKANGKQNQISNVSLDHSYTQFSLMHSEKENKLTMPASSVTKMNHVAESKNVLSDTGCNKNDKVNSTSDLQIIGGTLATKAPKKILTIEEYKRVKGICPTSKLVIEPFNKSKQLEWAKKMNLAVPKEIKNDNSTLSETASNKPLPSNENFPKSTKQQNVYVDACLVDEDALNKLDGMQGVLQKGHSKFTDSSLISSFIESIKNKPQSELDKDKVEGDGMVINYVPIMEKPVLVSAEVQTNISLMKKKQFKRSRSSSGSTDGESASSRTYGSGSSPIHMFNSGIRPPNSFRSRQEEDDFRDDATNRRILFLGEFPDDVDETELLDTFRIYGRIKQVKIYHKGGPKRMKSASGPKSKNYAFVTFYERESAFDALQNYKKDFPNGVDYLMSFGGRREFCKEQYADYDNMPSHYRNGDYRKEKEQMNFEDLLSEYKRQRAKISPKQGAQ